MIGFKQITTVVAMAAGSFALAGCGDTCESIKAEMEAIGQDIQKDPSTAMSRSDELQALQQKLAEMNCD
ncbi:MAG: hypothetical protein Tsb0016_20830 [Sphingomonadales bacterium]